MKHRHYVQERVKFNTEIIKVLALTVLATISGEITLFYQLDPFTGKAFVFLLSFFGLISIFAMIWAIFTFYKSNVGLIEKLK
jgi:hypothetical protein